MTEKSVCYRFKGIIQRPAIKKDRNGHDWIEFILQRDGKTNIPCRAFNDKADVVIENHREGDEIDVIGKFDSFAFQKRNGQQGSINYFHIVRVCCSSNSAAA